MATGLQRILETLHESGADLTDGQLLARFLATRDEASFTVLVRRHGPMVIGVCRRILRDEHDAEDAFQAAFLILAQKAASVVKRESLSCWLYQVAYHAALEACSARSRRRARERPVNDAAHPEIAPVETQDWRPLLDRELNALPEIYRSAIILCDLQGRTRKEAARQLRIPEGTLSSRLATAHKMLARRLTRSGLTLSGGALAAAILEGTASAQVPASLVGSTATAAALAAAQQLTTAATPAVLLMRGVLKTMLLNKLKRAVGALVILAALGAVGIAYTTSSRPAAAQGGPAGKAMSEVDALRKENELLKLNLEVVLEKVRAQEAELKSLRNQLPRRDSGMSGAPPGVMPRGGSGGPGPPAGGMGALPVIPPDPAGEGGSGAAGFAPATGGGTADFVRGMPSTPAAGSSEGSITPPADPFSDIYAVLKDLRDSRNSTPRDRQAADALDKAINRLKQQLRSQN
jgi:RNA polymerase sigma factor (sigma-70 family)